MNPVAVTMHSAIEEARRDPAAFIRLMGFSCNGLHVQLQDLWSEHDRSVVYAPVAAGKSFQNVLRLVWDLGNDPSARIAFISATEGLGTNIASTLRSLIKSSPVVRAVFPELKMSETQALDTVDSFRVERPDRGPDPSFKVYGVGAGEIQGTRLTHIVADDISTFANSLSAASRKKIIDWFRSAVLTRAAVEGVRVRILANPHHGEALPEVMAKQPGWELLRVGATDDAGLLTVPELTSHRQLEKKRAELGAFAPAMVDAITPATGRSMFTGEGIARCLDRGAGVPMPRTFPPNAAQVFSGVDIAGGTGGDRSAIVTIAVLAQGERRVLDVRSGNDWNGVRLVEEMRAVHRAYSSVFGVEANATQGLIADLAQDIPTIKITTTQQLKRFGMLGFATEIESGQWLLPSIDGEPCNEELGALIAEMETYSPSSHAGDRLMAALMAREAAAKHFDIFEQHEAAAQAELDLYAAYGIVVPPEERALIEGRSGFVDVNLDVLLGRY